MSCLVPSRRLSGGVLLPPPEVASILLWCCVGLAWGWVLVRATRSWIPRIDMVSAAVLVGSSTAASGVVAWGFAGSPSLVAWWWLAETGLGLSMIDLSCHRLPRTWVLAMGLGGVAVFSVVACTTSASAALVRAIAAGVLVFVVGAVLSEIPGRWWGFGDVTLSSALSVYCGWIGWSTVAFGTVAGLVVLGVVAAIAWVSGLRGRRSRIAAGPSLIAGAWIGVLCS